MSPESFWKMTIKEFFLLMEAKREQQEMHERVGTLDKKTFNKLSEMLDGERN